MNRATRRTVIAGNWKMNKTPAEATELINAIKAEINGKKTDECEIVACVPYVDITNAIEAAKGSPIKIGAENVHWEKSGAFTGEISADMLKAVGVEYVIIGHSERRQYFGETDVTVNKRVHAALAAGLKVILCVGELLEQREQGITAEIVSMQTKIDLLGVTADDMNPSGPLAPARPQPPNRLTRFAASSETSSQVFTARALQPLPQFSTAAA